MKKGLFTPALFGMEWYSETDKKYSNIYARLPLPPDIQSKRDLSVKITQTRLVIQFVNTKEPEMVVDALFARAVDVDESTWTIEEEDGKRFLVFLLAKKHNGENWPSLFAVEKNSAQEEVKIVAAKSSLTPEQIEKRRAADLVVLNGLMNKMQPEGKAEIERLLARGASPSDVLKMMQAQRQGKIKQ